MAKDSYWFKHDYNARNDEKILELLSEHGAEAYGIYWMIVETMAENENGGIKASLMGGLSHGFRVAKGRLIEIIECCLRVELLFEQDGFYYSNRMLKHKEERKLLSEMGKKGAEKKLGGYVGAKGMLKRREEIREEKKIKALFVKDNFAHFPDGSTQPLNEDEVQKLKQKKIMPHEILKTELS
jgi:hypothetical protein